MDVTEYIALFAEFFTQLIKMIKDFFASISGGSTDSEDTDDKAE